MSLLDTNAPTNVAFKQIFSGVDKLKAMGFKKKNIFKMISFHIGRRKSRRCERQLRPAFRSQVAPNCLAFPGAAKLLPFSNGT